MKVRYPISNTSRPFEETFFCEPSHSNYFLCLQNNTNQNIPVGKENCFFTKNMDSYILTGLPSSSRNLTLLYGVVIFYIIIVNSGSVIRYYTVYLMRCTTF